MGILKNIYKKLENAGASVADAKIAYAYKKAMDEAGEKLVKKFGKKVGAAAGIDDYYHPLLQCQLAKISDQSRENGLLLGKLKSIRMIII